MRSPMLRRLALPALALSLFVAPPAPASDVPRPPVASALGAADPVAGQLEQMRAAITEIEHQREVVWSLRERSFRVLRPGRLPSDARYPGSVLCQDGGVVYPADPAPTALAFCAGAARSTQ